jgi:hypothetical protein
MGSIMSHEEVKAIGRQRQEEARLTRPHTGRLAEPVDPPGGWTRIARQTARNAGSRERRRAQAASWLGKQR